ncbi:DUF1049 domain-containing protein [Paeniglutamicibacter antarcticus]|uniref:DUF1049 domain-containing protein n=1 Tax=Arthrobacter terrae TaxID=2935737 RepID=A0A931CQ94_9MICC|nr:lipopolysaccharide assembly protein LapA domain-containing protein [Arthrobacter terrae]MBG0740405.1 DUF1049 domain-containing protein [Arthrobacter terrae]
MSTEPREPQAGNPGRESVNPGREPGRPGSEPVDRKRSSVPAKPGLGQDGGSGSTGANSPDSPVGRKRTAAPPPGANSRTRAAAVWVAVAVSLVVLVLLIIFFIQNQDQVLVRFLGMEGSLALGIALFIAAVGGGILVALAGGARIVQLRVQSRRVRKLGNH